MANQLETTQSIADQANGTRERLQTIDPATGQPGQSYATHTIADARSAAAAAREAFSKWRRTSFADRAAVLRQAAAILRRRQDELAALMTEEMGKPLDDGRVEVEKCAAHCEWFAEHAEGLLARVPVEFGEEETFVTFNPLGVVLAVMPWNFPLWQVFRFAAPTLMAGNAALLKHASNVPGCALAIEQVLHEAGFPRDLFRTLLLPSSEVKALIEDDNVVAVTLTGSVAAGRSVASAAGGVIKKCVLELGGSDAYLVLDDVDVEAAAELCAMARMVNGGQSCISGKRFIVVRSLLEGFEQAMVGAMRAYEMGDPRAAGTRLGPMRSVQARDDIHAQVVESVRRGARLLLGGEVPDQRGAWYPPTVLTDVGPGQPAHDEEVFGPVAAIIAAEDEADAIRIANASDYGLGSGVVTADLDRGRRIAADELEAGLCFVNENVRSDSRIPFGGGQAFGLRARVRGLRHPRIHQHKERPGPEPPAGEGGIDRVIGKPVARLFRAPVDNHPPSAPVRQRKLRLLRDRSCLLDYPFSFELVPERGGNLRIHRGDVGEDMIGT
ncbi:MAG: succinate-semialdehyde dehydrogenase [Alphaproteobacteria bacterium]|nr:succinate-semialdehyde dehydrogenase [Alphaproteobacteria bacterium]